jgi:hypothetical protein
VVTKNPLSRDAGGDLAYRSTMKEITINVKKKDPQDNSLLVTPAAFYSNERDKTKLNWFPFEYAAEFNSHIKRH